LKKAAADHVVGHKSVKKASALLQSGMEHLIQAVDNGEITISTAYREYLIAKRAGRNPESVEAASGQWLYLITEKVKGSKWSKVGVGPPTVRFDEAQRGNPRKLWLAGTWWFRSNKEARDVEDVFKGNKKYPKALGGSEWREGMSASDVNEIAVLGGGRRSLVPGFHMGFRRKEGTNQLPNNQHRQAV
jgi:hypothetical protein